MDQFCASCRYVYPERTEGGLRRRDYAAIRAEERRRQHEDYLDTLRIGGYTIANVEAREANRKRRRRGTVAA